MSVWSESRESSFVFLQMEHLNRVICTIKTFQISVYDIGSKKQCKIKPVCFWGIQEAIESIFGEDSVNIPVRCCIYMLQSGKTMPSLYLRREMTGIPFSFVPLHLDRGFMTWCLEKNFWIHLSKVTSFVLFCVYTRQGINSPLLEWLLNNSLLANGLNLCLFIGRNIEFSR